MSCYTDSMSSTPLIILLHSSKTMRSSSLSSRILRSPQLIDQAVKLNLFLKTLSNEQLSSMMHISSQLAIKTHILIDAWSNDPINQTPAIDCFIGDIYSGLRAGELSQADRIYADSTLWILSGLYGFLRPLDGIYPYRLEMAYKLSGFKTSDLYTFWGTQIADHLPPQVPIVNVSSLEYTKVITPFVDPSRIVTPQFLTLQPKTGVPTFMAVHAKIARGAFARWLITSRTIDLKKFHDFHELGYQFSPELSTLHTPTFVCETFGGKGLSIRLQR